VNDELSKVVGEGLKDSGWDVFYVDVATNLAATGALYWSKAVMKDILHGWRITLSILLTFISASDIKCGWVGRGWR